ncbi:MAG: polysaccharide biosynthesis/export family protein, partial [Terriglobales bacterium]
MQRIPNFLFHLSSLAVVLGVVGLVQVALAQNNGPVQDATHQGNVTTEPSRTATGLLAGSPEQKTLPPTASLTLVIGPGDDLDVTVYGAPDLSEHTRVSADGNISMPLIGYVRIAGLSSSEAEGAIEAKLRQDKVVNDPQVSVYVKEYSSSGISVAGEVAKPGFYSALG